MRRHLCLTLAACLMIGTGPAFASNQDVVIPIVYTALTEGIFNDGTIINEAGPAFIPSLRGDVRAENVQIDKHFLRSGPYLLWSEQAALSPKTLMTVFESGLVVKGASASLPVLQSDYSVTYQLPSPEAPWVVSWLAEKNREWGRCPDARVGQSSLFKIEGANGIRLQLLSEDGSLPPADLWRDPYRWKWSLGVHFSVRRGRHSARIITVGTSFGNPYQNALASRLQASTGALRLDAGNLVESLNAPSEELSLPETIAEAKKAGFTAVVPYRNELALPQEWQAKLAEAVPLVAANLQAPPGIPLVPYVVREHEGLKVAIVGLADTADLKRRGLLGGNSGWQGEEPKKALERVLPEVRNDVQAIILLTNLGEKELPEVRESTWGVTAIVEAKDRRRFPCKERIEAALHRSPYPWLVTGAAWSEVGLMRINFRKEAVDQKPRVTWIENELQRASDKQGEPDPRASFAQALREDGYVETHREPLLPDMRAISENDKRLESEPGDPHIQYQSKHWSALAASIVRRSSEAELAVLPLLEDGSNFVGDMPRYHVEGWMPRTEKLALTVLSGAQIKRLVAMDEKRERFAFAGYDPATELINGRSLGDNERYRVMTTLSIAANEAYASIFQEPLQTSLRLASNRIRPQTTMETLSVQEVGVAYLDHLKQAHGGFTPAYREQLKELLFDDGQVFEPTWTFGLTPLQGSFQQFQVSNRSPFSAVANSQINTPDNTAWGGKIGLRLMHQNADLDWDNRLKAEYQQATFQVGNTSVMQKLSDNMELDSEVRLKFVKLQAQKSSFSLVPFLSANYQTEFTPTVDQQTGSSNPRRRELSGIAGMVLYPQSWLKEIRLGVIAKDDLAAASTKIQPGAQLASGIEQRLGPMTLNLDMDLKNYFLTPDDTASDLGFVGQFNAGLSFPLWSGFSLRVGVDSLLFSGKVASNRSLGNSFTPSVGLTYNTTWKPLQGLMY